MKSEFHDSAELIFKINFKAVKANITLNILQICLIICSIIFAMYIANNTVVQLVLTGYTVIFLILVFIWYFTIFRNVLNIKDYKNLNKDNYENEDINNTTILNASVKLYKYKSIIYRRYFIVMIIIIGVFNYINS